MNKTYTEEFRAKQVERMCGPKAISAAALSREIGVHQTILSKWRRQSTGIKEGASGKAKESTVATAKTVKKRDGGVIEVLQTQIDELEEKLKDLKLAMAVIDRYCQPERRAQ